MYSETQYGWETTRRATPASAWRTPTLLLPSCHLTGSRLRPLAASCKSGSELKWSRSAADRPRGERLGWSKHQLIWSSAVQFLPFLSNQKQQKERKKTFHRNYKELIVTLNQNLLLIHFVFSLIVTNARNVKYIKLNIYIKRFWTSY